jgi:hypothetical protein
MKKIWERDLLKVLNARTPLEEFVFPPQLEEHSDETEEPQTPPQPPQSASTADEDDTGKDQKNRHADRPLPSAQHRKITNRQAKTKRKSRRTLKNSRSSNPPPMKPIWLSRIELD